MGQLGELKGADDGAVGKRKGAASRGERKTGCGRLNPNNPIYTELVTRRLGLIGPPHLKNQFTEANT